LLIFTGYHARAHLHRLAGGGELYVLPMEME
jgi:hypothetical protein